MYDLVRLSDAESDAFVVGAFLGKGASYSVLSTVDSEGKPDGLLFVANDLIVAVNRREDGDDSYLRNLEIYRCQMRSDASWELLVTMVRFMKRDGSTFDVDSLFSLVAPGAHAAIRVLNDGEEVDIWGTIIAVDVGPGDLTSIATLTVDVAERDDGGRVEIQRKKIEMKSVRRCSIGGINETIEMRKTMIEART